MSSGTLYIVATPIGNLDDFSPRAVRVLREVDAILAEDTRHSAALLRHFHISTPVRAFHEHNERARYRQVCDELEGGHDLALISDAGTPLISDPGYRLVREAHRRDIPVVPVPGPSAVMAALSSAGLPTDRFAFEGFLPARGAARRARLEILADEPRTLVFLEAPHRLQATLHDLRDCFGAQREACLAREISKRHETIRLMPLEDLVRWVDEDPDQRRGEAVLVVAGAEAAAPSPPVDLDRLLTPLLARLPLKEAVAVAVEATGLRRNEVYQRALALQGRT